MITSSNVRHQHGFTLSEVLISIVLLAVVAAFTLPKILQNIADAQEKSVFKDTFSTLSQTFYNGVLSGELDDASLVSYMQSHINALRTCTDSMAEGCYTVPINLGSAGWNNMPGILLPNGAFIWIWGTPQNDKIRTMCVDFNGMQLPNIIQQDIGCFISCQQADTPNWPIQCQRGGIVSHYYASNLAFNQKYAFSP